MLGVTPGAANQLLKRARVQGIEAPRRHPLLAGSCGSQPSKLATCRHSLRRDQRHTALVARSGPPAVSARRSGAPSVSYITRPTSAACYKLAATVSSVPSSGRASATRRLSAPGGRSAGRRPKKATEEECAIRPGRPIGLLPAAAGRRHLGATPPDTGPVRAADRTAVWPRWAGSLWTCACASRRRHTSTDRRMSCTFCACCCARSPTSRSPSGTGRPFIAANRSSSSSPAAPPSTYIWGGYRVTNSTSTRSKDWGTASSASN